MRSILSRGLGRNGKEIKLQGRLGRMIFQLAFAICEKNFVISEDVKGLFGFPMYVSIVGNTKG